MRPQRTTHRVLTVIGLILAIAVSALEATVVATAMPTVIGDLGGIHQYAWVSNAYLLASSVTVPIYGKLSDIYGRKPIMLFGIVMFLLGSVASGAAQSMPQLIAFRALQGLGAGAMQPMSLTITGDIFNLEERARMQGLFGAAWGLFGLTGPMLGGVIVHYLSWRWVFYVNLPFGVAAAALILGALHERVERRRHALDFLGAGLLSAGVIALLLATGRSGGISPLFTGAAAVFLLAAFIAAERRAPEPLIPLPLFARPVLFVSSLTGAIIGGAMIATCTYVPLFVQGVLRGSPTDAGSAITPMVIGWPIASAVSGRLIPRLGFRPLIRVGLAITASAAVALAFFAEGDTLNGLRLTTLAFGVGMGLSNTALLIAVQTSVEWQQRGIVTASTTFFRTIGGALAIGVMGGVLNAALSGDQSVPADAASQLLNPEGLRALDPALAERLGHALAGGLDTVFWIIAGMSVAGFLVTLWFPHVALVDHATPPAHPAAPEREAPPA